MAQRKGDKHEAQRRKVKWYMRFEGYRRVDVFQVAQRKGDTHEGQRRKVEWYMRFEWYRRVDVF